MEKERGNTTIYAAVAGDIIIAVILVLGTIWMGRIVNVAISLPDEDGLKDMQSLQAGVDAYLSKPVQPEALFEALEKPIRD